MSTSATAAGFDGLARILAAFAVCCQLHNAQVNAKNTFRDNQRRVGNTHCRQQIELAINKGKVGLALAKSKQPMLIVPANKGQFEPTVNRPNRNLLTLNIPVEDAVIKGNCARGLKRALSALVQFVGVGYFADTPHDDLSRQSRLGPLSRILRFVKRVLPECLVFPSPCADAVANSVRGLHGALQCVRLFGSDNQFYLCGKFQSISFNLLTLYPQLYRMSTLHERIQESLRQTGSHSSVA